MNQGYAEPRNPLHPEDVEAAERSHAMYGGWFSDPVILTGDYPPRMKQRVYEYSMQQGLNKSRLPEFTEAEKLMIKGKIIMNHIISFCFLVKMTSYIFQNP